MGKKPAQSAATRQKLMCAFWELYTQKGIEQISIREVTDLAGCNRGTFYIHFRDIYDILNQIEDSFFPAGTFPFLPGNSSPNMTVRQMIRKMASLYEHYGKYVTVLLGDHGDPRFVQRLKEQYMLILSSLPRVIQMDETIRPYFIEYCCCGVMAMIHFWLNQKPQPPAEDFILIAIQILMPESAQKLLTRLDEPLSAFIDTEALKRLRELSESS